MSQKRTLVDNRISNMLDVGYDLLIYNPPGLSEPSLAMEGSRQGGMGIIDLEYLDVERIGSSIEKMESENLPFGVRVDPMSEKLQALITGELPKNMRLLIAMPKETLPDMVRSTIYETAHSMGLKVFQEVCTGEEADASVEAGVDGLILRGAEGGGRVASIPLEDLVRSVEKENRDIPIITRGAVSLGSLKDIHVSGIVLDSQLFTLEESGLPERIRGLLSSFKADSSFLLGSGIGRCFRFVATVDVKKELTELETSMLESGEEPKNIYRTLKAAIEEFLLSSYGEGERILFPAGEDLLLSKDFEGYGGLEEALSDLFGMMNGKRSEEEQVTGKGEEKEMKGTTVDGRPVPPDYYDGVVAVVGMGSVFPKGIGNDTYWKLIMNGVDACQEVPKDRWDWKYYYDPDRKAKDKTYTKIGAFITGLKMDFREFKMPPKMFDQIDDYQRYAMRAAKEALIDAGILDNKSIDRTRVGVILSNSGGGENRDWGSVRVSIDEITAWMDEVEEWMRIPADARSKVKEELKKVLDTKLIPINEDSMPGCLPNIAAGRLANLFNFQGPSFITDAACASSLSAVQTARNALILKQMDIAVS
ncbi:MAG: beta-ketoacyl synthase N-terminal-like domain-containing protein, partial [Candidatus Thermoplasmatota archaeon]|nr:beta-ketoacyl synthase N-terminal-like domain-containing protein [Candidatus Thermoplasmatota archaeon]